MSRAFPCDIVSRPPSVDRLYTSATISVEGNLLLVNSRHLLGAPLFTIPLAGITHVSLVRESAGNVVAVLGWLLDPFPGARRFDLKIDWQYDGADQSATFRGGRRLRELFTVI